MRGCYAGRPFQKEMLASLADEISDSIIRPRGSFFGQSCFTFRPRSGDGDSCFNLPPSCTAAVWPREGADPAVRMLACGRSLLCLPIEGKRDSVVPDLYG